MYVIYCDFHGMSNPTSYLELEPVTYDWEFKQEDIA